MDTFAIFQQGAALLAAFLVGFSVTLHAGVTAGQVVAFLLIPLWAPALSRFAGARTVLALGVVTVTAGYLLSADAATEGFLISGSNALHGITDLLGAVVCIGVLLWGRTVVGLPSLGAATGFGMIAYAAVSGTNADGNAWKFIWAVPVSVFVLGLSTRSARIAPGVVMLLLLTVVSAVESCRSYSAALVLTAVVLLWRARAGHPGSRRSWWVLTAGFVAALAAGLYYLASSLLVSGYLGAASQARTIAQLQTSGSLLLGGRPEISATWALMKYRPSGYGIGVIPGPQDILIAKSGMSNIGYNPDNGYVEKYMFGGHIELHSVIGDMWASYGIMGVVFTAAVAVLMVRHLSIGISRRQGNALTFFLAVWMLWNVAFSPLASSMSVLILAVAALLPDKQRSVTA